MSDATKRMRDFLTKSPSVVYPDEVLELFAPVEAENTKLRELVKDIDEVADPALWEFIGRRMRELGIEVDG